MSFAVKSLAASVNTAGERLDAFLMTYPRIIHQELLTHRVFSRNSMSSRAIPVAKTIQEVVDNPFVPQHWGAAQKGMQAYEEVPQEVQDLARREWLRAREMAVSSARSLADLGLHKQVVNRLLEPFQWMRTIVSTTSMEHFKQLRTAPDAEPHFQMLARMMVEVYENTTPTLLQEGEWHLPLVGFNGDEALALAEKIKVSTARCGRVSYLTHEGIRDVQKDLELHDSFIRERHWSPPEHPATPAPGQQIGNYRGWKQYRKFFANEFVPDQIA